jgi:hypothetical protein
LVHSRLSVGLLAAGTLLLPARFAPSGQETFALVVSPAEARYEIRVPRRQWWEWNRAETPANAMEWEWSVEFPVGEATCELGFTLFKRPGSRSSRGGLGSLLAAGQTDAWLRGPRGGSRMDIPVRAEFRNGILALRVVGEANVRRLFRGRPEVATVVWRVPGRPAAHRRIPIMYVGRDTGRS